MITEADLETMTNPEFDSLTGEQIFFTAMRLLPSPLTRRAFKDWLAKWYNKCGLTSEQLEDFCLNFISLEEIAKGEK